MKPRRILVPIDFSASSDAALEMATSLARDNGGSLMLVHVEVIPLSATGGEYLYAMPEPPTEELLAKLDAIVLPDSHIPVERRLLAGDPADAIIRLAQTEDVEMIVMGGPARVPRGSSGPRSLKWESGWQPIGGHAEPHASPRFHAEHSFGIALMTGINQIPPRE
jgi:nucleotide-binding universal stress UspA family protein